MILIVNVNYFYPKIYSWYEYYLFGGSKQRKNSELDVVDFYIFS